MKASNGIILNIFEAHIDPSYYSLSKLNVQIQITHGSVELHTKISSSSDSLPKWNQTFYLEKQSESITLNLIHKPLLSKDMFLGSCKLQAIPSSGWVHLFSSSQKIGSLKISISTECPLDHSEIADLYEKKISEVQSIKSKLSSYKLKYESEKLEQKSINPKIDDLMLELKQEQENYLKLFNEVNEKKRFIKEQEEFIVSEREKIEKAKRDLKAEEELVKNEQRALQNEFDEMILVKNKVSLQDRILKGYHRSSKSEKRSPLSREAYSSLSFSYNSNK